MSALAAIDFEPLEVEPERADNRRRAYTHEEAVALAHSWMEATGAPPTKREWNPSQQLATVRRMLARIERLQDSIDRFRTGGFPAEVTIRNLFGSWDAFMHSCGWEPRGPGRPRIQSAPEPPPTPSRDQVLRGAGSHVDERRRRELVDRERDQSVGTSILAARLRGVASAHKGEDPQWLAGELEGLAATALAWADRLRGERSGTAASGGQA